MIKSHKSLAFVGFCFIEFRLWAAHKFPGQVPHTVLWELYTAVLQELYTAVLQELYTAVLQELYTALQALHTALQE